MRRLAYLGAVAAALLAIAPAALAKTETASRAGITASFTFHGTTENPTGQRLTIARGATVLYAAPVHDPFCGAGCGPGGYYNRSSVHVLDLAHTGQQDVVLDLYSGGAHCCFIEQVFAPTASGAYAQAGDHNFFDPGATLEDLAGDGRYEFVSADDHFSYAFTPFSDSGLPLQIWSVSGGRFIDVTKHFPHAIAADGRRWLRAFRSQAHGHFRDSVGVIAAWAADEDRLGKHAAVDHYLSAQARAGHLNSFAPNPSGTAFIAALHRVLRRLGYL